MTSNDRDHVAKARELLAAEYERDGFLVSARRARNPSAHVDPHAIRAIVAALTAKREADAPAVVGGWRAKAAEWLEAQAGEQEANNARWPEHAAAYKSWRDRPAELRILASKLLAAAPTPPAADGECGTCGQVIRSDALTGTTCACAEQPAADTGRGGELLPCPFCGDESHLHVEHLEGTIIHPAYRVRCDNCGAAIEYTDKDHVGTWNTRAIATPAPAVGRWIAADDVSRLVREIDVALNGEEGAAGQASLCDIASQVTAHARKHGPVLAAPAEVYVDLPTTVGTCGPFPIVDDRISIPNETITDIVKRATPAAGPRVDAAMVERAQIEYGRAVLSRTGTKEAMTRALQAALADTTGQEP